MKLLSTLSMNISEEEYRDIKALDYSAISRFTNTGFNGLETIFDKIESPALTFGNVVDCLLTCPNEFDEKFMVCELSEPSEKVKKAVENLYNNTNYEWLSEVPFDKVIEELNNVEYQGNWKDDKRYSSFCEKGDYWFRHLVNSEGKTVITKEVYDKAVNVVDVVKSSENTKFYFQPNVEFADIQRFYQLKFKAKLKDDIEYKSMMDEIVVDYYKKEITIVDFKTTSGKEWDFVNSFLKYNYHQQARLYTRVLDKVLKQDELFSKFKIVGFKFIVANVDNPQPLIWDCDFYNCAYGPLIFGKENNIIIDDPEDKGKELKFYLDNNPKVPNNINLYGENSIKEFLKEM